MKSTILKKVDQGIFGGFELRPVGAYYICGSIPPTTQLPNRWNPTGLSN